jgi:hypothetical protein
MIRKTAPPFCPARYGNRQMLLNPMAEPVAARIKPSCPEKFPRLAILWSQKTLYHFPKYALNYNYQKIVIGMDFEHWK